MRWTVEQVAGALGVETPKDLNPLARMASVSIDSRTIHPGELFFAVRGPRHDGHSFVAQALASGALAGVVDQARWAGYPEAIRGQLFPVEDTFVALQNLARSACRLWRASRPGRRLAAITGSAGKTTTKEVLAAILATRFRVLKSEGNLNNAYGLPLTLLRLDEEDAAVVELGMSERGELTRLAKIAEPDLGVVTNVAPVHLEFFSSVDEIALAKRELIEGLAGPQPVAVLNADDARVARLADGFRGRVLTYGLSAGAMFRAEAIEDRGAEGTAFDFVAPAGRTRVELPLPGRHNVYNALAGLAAASEWHIDAEMAQRAFAVLKPAHMRGEILQFEKGFTVINDSYNSNPVALASMVDLLATAPGYRRRILAAGEMLELGPTAAEVHREAGRHAGLKRLDWIIGVGGQSKELVNGAMLEDHPSERTQFFPSSEEAGTFLTGLIAQGDLLLVKGSRCVRMEKIIDALKTRYALVGGRATVETSGRRRG
jgi:UDP-N-acetylmuramoyl-tripeptide--D-alanyl-D-alanine ligase